MMRQLIIFLICLSTSHPLHAGRLINKKPCSLEETYSILDVKITDDIKTQLKIWPEADATTRLYFIAGIWIGNNFNLWKKSKLKQYFVSRGILHPYYMIDIIITYYYRKFNNLPIQLNQMLSIYQSNNFGTHLYKNDTIYFPDDFFDLTNRCSEERLNSNFSIGDTIIINEFNRLDNQTPTKSPLLSIAIVRKIRSNRIELEIIKSSVKKRNLNPPKHDIYEPGGKKVTAFVYDIDRIVGLIYEEAPGNCGFKKPEGFELN